MPGGSERHGNDTPTFGRERELADIDSMFRDGARLVTLVGRGGVGKTHLAREIAARRARATFVPLSAVVDPTRVMAEIAAAMGLPALPSSDPLTAVALRAEADRTLVVLDNFEHVLPAVSDVGELLDRAPSCRVLVTSQTSLRLAAERTSVIEPLPLPDPSAPLTDLVSEPAVAMYSSRARAVDSRFDLGEENAADVAVLCRLLDGLPLALELAAARSATLPAAQLATRLESAPLDLLQDPRRQVPARHQALRAAIGWTYAQLPPDEQRLLRRLSIAEATFTLEDAEELGGGGAGSAGEAIDGLSSLVDFHLVDLVRRSEPLRYAMPSSIRAFAMDELLAADEYAETVEAYITWSARWARQAVRDLATPDEVDVMQRIALASENLVHVCRLALGGGRISEALDIAVAAAVRWGYAGSHPSLEALLADVLAASTELQNATRARLLAFHALWIYHAGDASQGAAITQLLDDAEAQARDLDDVDARLESYNVRAMASPLTLDYEGALRVLMDGLPLAERTGDDRWIARFELLTSAVTMMSGDDAQAITHATSALDRSRRVGFAAGQVAAGAILRSFAVSHPELDAIAPSTADSIALARRIGMPWYDVALLPVLVLEALEAGDVDAARRHVVESLTQVHGADTPVLQGIALVAASEVAAAVGDCELALVLDAVTAPYTDVITAYSSGVRMARHAESVARWREELGVAAESAEDRARSLTLNDAIALGLAAWQPREQASSVAGPDPSPRSERLTPRQREVLVLLASGLRNTEIAAHLNLTPKTVMHHTSAIYTALDVRGRTEATAWAVRAGLVG